MLIYCFRIFRILLSGNPHRYRTRYHSFLWQQDGASPQYWQAVRDYLDETFAEWIGCQGTVEWPSLSPDLTS